MRNIYTVYDKRLLSNYIVSIYPLIFETLRYIVYQRIARQFHLNDQTHPYDESSCINNIAALTIILTKIKIDNAIEDND